MKGNENEKIHRATVVRYVLLQLPALALVSLLAFFITEKTGLDWFWKWIAIALWALKDLVMFPFVWRSYASRPEHTVHSMVGKKGIARDRLAPSGYVRVGNELWKAHIASTGICIEKNEKITVTGMKGLTLLVEPEKRTAEER